MGKITGTDAKVVLDKVPDDNSEDERNGKAGNSDHLQIRLKSLMNFFNELFIFISEFLFRKFLV